MYMAKSWGKCLFPMLKLKKTEASVARWMNMGKIGKRDCRTCWGGARPLCYCWNTKSQGLPLAPNSSCCKRVPWIETDPFLSAFLDWVLGPSLYESPWNISPATLVLRTVHTHTHDRHTHHGLQNCVFFHGFLSASLTEHAMNGYNTSQCNNDIFPV